MPGASTDKQIPVLVLPGMLSDFTEVVWVVPGVPLNGDQMSFLTTRLSEASLHCGAGFWVMRAANMAGIAFKAPGITPEYYMRWSDAGAPAAEPAATPPPQHQEVVSPDVEFIDAMARRSGFNDRHAAAVFYHAFCQVAIEWLLDDRKPLNLGFCRLHAMPYRINWREILAAKFEGLGRILRDPAEKRDATLEAMNFDAHLCSASLAEMRDGGAFGWNLFIEPTHPWNKYNFSYEQASLLEHTPPSYATRWANLAMERRATSLDLLGQFFAAASVPNAVVDRRLPPNSRALLPARQGRIRAASPPLPVTRAVLPDPESGPAVGEDSIDAEAHEEVREMPDAGLDLANVRNNRGDAE